MRSSKRGGDGGKAEYQLQNNAFYARHTYTQLKLLAMKTHPHHSSPPTHPSLSIHNNHRPQPLHRLNNLLRLLLRHPLLHLLRRTLDKLLAVHQTQPQHALDLLDDFRFRGRVERLERQGEEGLFLRCGRGFFFFFDGGAGARGGGCWAGCGEAAHGHVGDVEAGLERREVVLA